jgi:broad specificity phosphatase PhoE
LSTIFFLTHPEVVIDPAVPVPRWPLSEKGRRRARLFVDEALVGRRVTAVWSSDERKALDGAEIVAGRLGVPHRIDPELGENDRSSTGYVAPPEFWEIVAEFFAKPDESVRGWATARDEQARIVAAVTRLAREEPTTGDVVVVSHGGVGQLLTAHLRGVEIGQEDKPQHPGGGCWLEIDREALAIVGGWRSVGD